MKTQQKPTNTSKSADTVKLWTIGHGNGSMETSLELLTEHDIEVLVDVRSFPTSKIQHFKQEQMKRRLPQNGIEYVWLGKELGGYRRGGYKAHVRTKIFKEGIQKLLEIAAPKKACIMCMDPTPKHCHRRFISAPLKEKENQSRAYNS